MTRQNRTKTIKATCTSGLVMSGTLHAIRLAENVRCGCNTIWAHLGIALAERGSASRSNIGVNKSDDYFLATLLYNNIAAGRRPALRGSAEMRPYDLLLRNSS